MKFLHRGKKTLAVFLLINFITQIVAPTVSYALTSGPTAPEFSSFEPVDTTDMVDLKTGDFNYTTPLFEIPGPAGSYPISLSYHAGIQPDQEASWVGLGWTLNPGAITRLVNGYPDDHNAVTDVVRTIWEGGISKSYTAGISVGIANAATVSAGLTFAHDTYRGSGLGVYGGGGVGIGIGNSPLSLGLSGQIGTSPYGGSYYSAGIGLGVGTSQLSGLNLSANVGLSYNSASKLDASTGVGISARNSGGNSYSLMDASISTNGTKPQLSTAGSSNTATNSRQDIISSTRKNFLIDIPVYQGINLRLGRSSVRYWIDEDKDIATYGSIYLSSQGSNANEAFDVYDLMDTDLEAVDFPNAEKVLGGSFPDYDYYSVTAQGLAGNIRPYHFRKHLSRQEKKNSSGEVDIKNYKINQTDNDLSPVHFRFINDFSNRYEYDAPGFMGTSNGLSYDFSGNPLTGEKGNDGFTGNALAGSKHVQSFSNAQIVLVGSESSPSAKNLGFINCKIDGFNRENNSLIGGYSITNSSGVTYHYALPAYSYDEFIYQQNSAKEAEHNGLYRNTLTKPSKYAYTWLLTAVTGPDFVDANSNGLADQGDAGYWVEFKYKKYLNDYKWRNPAIGFNKDLDGEMDNYSSGKKEVYYLDAILTETHAAVFEKTERMDGREVMSLSGGGFNSEVYVSQPGKQSCINNCEQNNCTQGNCQQPQFDQCTQNCQNLPDDVYEINAPRPSLKLDRIKLISRENFNSGNLSEQFLLRKIDFTYDYSLAKNTPNSYDVTNSIQNPGKLTLKSLITSGKGGASLLPPTKFEYNKNPNYQFDFFDTWGFYKNDFSSSNADNEYLKRRTTSSSALDTDAWSLSSIISPVGAVINIQYESDEYKIATTKSPRLDFRIKNIERTSVANRLKITFWEDKVLSGFFNMNESIPVETMALYYMLNHTRLVGTSCPVLDVAWQNYLDQNLYLTPTYNSQAIVTNVQPDFIEIEDALLFEWLSRSEVDVKFAKNKSCFSDNAYTINYSIEDHWPDYIVGGFAGSKNNLKNGGGIRVKSISLASGSEVRKTLYTYYDGLTTYEPNYILPPKINPDLEEHIDGRPEGGPFMDYYAAAYSREIFKKKLRRDFKRSIYKSYQPIINAARELPGPGVMYAKVKVEEQITKDGDEFLLPNYSVFEFEGYSDEKLQITNSAISRTGVSSTSTQNNPPLEGAMYRDVRITDWTVGIGNLKTITLFDRQTNTPVTRTTNHYLDEGLNFTAFRDKLKTDFNNQGLINESFTQARSVKFSANSRIPDGSYDLFPSAQYQLLAVLSTRTSIPSVQIGQTNENFKTNILTRNDTKEFDFYSGEALKIKTVDSYGNATISAALPAYKVYPTMGLKSKAALNKNMLTQTASSYSYAIDAADKPLTLLSGSVQTWSDQVPSLTQSIPQVNIWRKYSTYQWNGAEPMNENGSYPIAEWLEATNEQKVMVPFNWTSPDTDDRWENLGSITLYDLYSHALEAKDINDNFGSTRMDPKFRRVIANSSNAAYSEAAYSGAEYSLGNTVDEGGVNCGTGTPTVVMSHTGKYSLSVAGNQNGFNYVIQPKTGIPMKKYKASVWMYAPGEGETQTELNKVQLFYSIGGEIKKYAHATAQKNKSKNWYLLELDIMPQGQASITVGVRNLAARAVNFDDFRVHPLNGSMTSYVYDQVTGELSYVLDGNNFYTHFKYDAMGRLVRTSRELLNFDYGPGKETLRADQVVQEAKYNDGKNIQSN